MFLVVSALTAQLPPRTASARATQTLPVSPKGACAPSRMPLRPCDTRTAAPQPTDLAVLTPSRGSASERSATTCSSPATCAIWSGVRRPRDTPCLRALKAAPSKRQTVPHKGRIFFYRLSASPLAMGPRLSLVVHTHISISHKWQQGQRRQRAVNDPLHLPWPSALASHSRNLSPFPPL
jgi:hypothetical protein